MIIHGVGNAVSGVYFAPFLRTAALTMEREDMQWARDVGARL